VLMSNTERVYQMSRVRSLQFLDLGAGMVQEAMKRLDDPLNIRLSLIPDRMSGVSCREQKQVSMRAPFDPSLRPF